MSTDLAKKMKTKKPKTKKQYFLMNVANRYFQRKYNDFKEKFNTLTLEDYFGIPKNPNCSLRFTFSNKEDELVFTITCIQQNPCPPFDLPLDICNVIDSYNKNYLQITISILYTEPYPFHAPKWLLRDVKHNLIIPLNLTNYYTYIVQNHNEQYSYDWSPAISIEKDILNFIQKVMHFEYIVGFQ